MGDELSMWTIYWRPADRPHQYVARRFVVTASGGHATDDVMESPDIMDLREDLARRGLFQLGRHAGDDPAVVETWL